MAKYLLDTTVFNRALDGLFNPATVLADGTMHATAHQMQELKATKKEARREELVNAFAEVEPGLVATASAVWGVSEWDAAEWTPADSIVPEIAAKLVELEGDRGDNQWRDALVLETAIRNAMTLVTADGNLADLAVFYDCDVIKID